MNNFWKSHIYTGWSRKNTTGDNRFCTIAKVISNCVCVCFIQKKV